MLLRITGLMAGLTAATLAAAPNLPRLNSITTDGDLADWGEGGLHLPFLTPNSPRPLDSTRSHVSARFAWDDSGLLVAVEVTDTTPNEAHLPSAAYTADSIEVFLALDAAKADNIQLMLSPGRDPVQPAPRSYVFDNRSAQLHALPNDIKWAVKSRADGYVAEARLPWSALGIQPAPGLSIASRLFVNDVDGAGGHTRFVWQPEASAGRFHALTLAADESPQSLGGPVAWTALDVADTTGRVNLMAPSALAGSSWQVRQGDNLLGELSLKASGPVASGSLALPAGRASGSLTLSGPDNALLTVRDNLANDAAGAIGKAYGFFASLGDKAILSYARPEFSQHIFSGRRFPTLKFIDPARVERLLGSAPTISTQWLDTEGRDVTAPETPGHYAARSEIRIAGQAKPVVLEHTLYRLHDGVSLPPAYHEAVACLYAFGLQGADATPTHAARVVERWWHKVRRARGWSVALPYKIHVPAGAADGPRPLIVHLHGAGQHTEMAANERLPLLIKQAGPEPIIVYPQFAGVWRGPAVGEMIDSLKQQYSIDPARIYLIGFSMGGMGSWEVALDQPERFAAVVPIGGRMGSPADAARLKDVPLWVINGDADPTTTCEDAKTMVDAVRRAGGKPQFTILPGKSHGDSQDAAYCYPGLFKWMLEQRRTSAGSTSNAEPAGETAPVETDPRLHSNGNGWKLNQATVVDKTRPRVLLMGDSILAGYQKFVIENVGDKAYIDTWVQPYHQGHMLGPLPKMIEEVLAKGPYDVIVFNMGLHGWTKGRIPDGQFTPLTKKLVETLRQNAPKAHLVWLSSTPVSEADTRPEFSKLGPPPKPYSLNSEINPIIVEHNRLAAEVMKEEKVPVLDLYSALLPQLNLPVGDMFHWTEPASKLMAAEITQVILSNLPKR